MLLVAMVQKTSFFRKAHPKLSYLKEVPTGGIECDHIWDI